MSCSLQQTKYTGASSENTYTLSTTRSDKSNCCKEKGLHKIGWCPLLNSLKYFLFWYFVKHYVQDNFALFIKKAFVLKKFDESDEDRDMAIWNVTDTDGKLFGKAYDFTPNDYGITFSNYDNVSS